MSDTAVSDTTSKGTGNHLKLLAVLGAGAVVVLSYLLLPVSEWLTSFQSYVNNFGALGWLIFIVVYALTAFFLIPGSILTVAAGVAYGLWAFPLVIAGATLGSAISFLAARHVFHDKVQSRIGEYPKFSAVNEAIREEGWRVVFLLRLSPALPFSLQNWFLGLMPVGFWPSQIATFFGIMPGTLLYVWVSSLGGEAAAGGMQGASILRYTLLGIGLLATLAVTVIITRKAREKLKEFSVE